MAMPWTEAAKEALLAGARVEWLVYIDVESGINPPYGLNVVNVTSRLMRIDRIERSTSCVERDWTFNPTVFTFSNIDAYFTPNYFGFSRQGIQNIWRTRPSGEADPRKCKLYCDMTVHLADGSTETVRMLKGKIVELNIPVDREELSCELSVRDDSLDSLNVVYSYEDGFEGEYRLR